MCVKNYQRLPLTKENDQRKESKVKKTTSEAKKTKIANRKFP